MYKDIIIDKLFAEMTQSTPKRQSHSHFSNNQPDNQTQSVPAGLRPIHNILTSHGWKPPHYRANHFNQHQHQHQPHCFHPQTQICSNNPSYICEMTYIKDPSSDDEFRIRTTKDRITVAVPIANSPYLYASSFKNYYLATDFVERHLMTYEEKLSSNATI